MRTTQQIAKAILTVNKNIYKEINISILLIPIVLSK
mgnify:CR=1 FL=1